jgi:hypothetical protein
LLSLSFTSSILWDESQAKIIIIDGKANSIFEKEVNLCWLHFRKSSEQMPVKKNTHIKKQPVEGLSGRNETSLASFD